MTLGEGMTDRAMGIPQGTLAALGSPAWWGEGEGTSRVPPTALEFPLPALALAPSPESTSHPILPGSMGGGGQHHVNDSK